MKYPTGRITHGTSSDCPKVQSGEWERCLGHTVFAPKRVDHSEKLYLRSMGLSGARVSHLTAEQLVEYVARWCWEHSESRRRAPRAVHAMVDEMIRRMGYDGAMTKLRLRLAQTYLAQSEIVQ